jgi:carbon storage regulator CsrA
MIGPDIEVQVVRVSGNKVRLAVRAPVDIKVHRKEITEIEGFQW